MRAGKHSHGTGGGSHANTELGGQAELSHPCGDREDWWDTHTAGTREQRAWERWEHGEEPVVNEPCGTQIKAQVCGLRNVLWHSEDQTPNPWGKEEHVEAPAQSHPLHPHISARLLHSGIFCCWKGSAFTRGRLRDSAAWELPHLHNQPQFPLQTGFSSMLHICDHHQLLGHSWRQQIHLSFNSAKLRNSVAI